MIENLPSEEWRPVIGYEGLYEISNKGRLASLKYKRTPGLRGILSPSPGRGYKIISLYKKGRPPKLFTIHYLVCRAFIGERPEGFTINHKNGIKTDNSVENLEYCTPSYNSKHSFLTGAQCNKGIKHSQAKLNDAKVRLIRAYDHIQENAQALSDALGVTVGCIRSVWLKRTWPHII